MTRQDSDEVTFHDVSTYFSEEEWKLLHEWQKNLYRSVMNEIHQALMSLELHCVVKRKSLHHISKSLDSSQGPLITTTVVSLRAKEKEVLRCFDNHESERKRSINPSPRDTMINPVFHINRGERHLTKPQDTGERDAGDCLGRGFPLVSMVSTDSCLRKAEEPVLHFYGEEIQEHRTDPEVGQEVVLCHIKDEQEHYCDQEINGLDNVSRDTGAVTVNGEQVRYNVKHTGKATPIMASVMEAKTKLPLIYENEVCSRNQQWSELSQERGRKETTQHEKGFSEPAPGSFHMGTCNVTASETCNQWKSNLVHANIIAHQPTLHKNLILYSCAECKKAFSKKEYLIRHKQKHMGMRPFKCTECGKGFRKKDNLSVHKRTHTGERPYRCNMCDKRFSQKGVLNRHQVTHMVERPYQCTICEKSFCQKGGLNRHLRIHKTITGE